MSRMCKSVNVAAHRSGFTLLITSKKLLKTCLKMLPSPTQVDNLIDVEVTQPTPGQ